MSGTFSQLITSEHLSENLEDWPPLMPAYERLFDELGQKKYEVRTVFDHYIVHQGHANPDKPTIILRIDVDAGFHLSFPLALHLHARGITASHFFLTDESRYYNLWNSKIPKKIASLGQEVGLHSDHLFLQITKGIDGIEKIRDDVTRLSNLAGLRIGGMVYHGHPEMDELGRCNVELYDNILPEDLGLIYHDGLASCYRDVALGFGKPKCDARVIDFMGIPRSWGWNYLPWYPVNYIKKHAQPGGVLCVDFHTHNAFQYWLHWPGSYNETFRSRESFLTFHKKRLWILARLYALPVIFKILKALEVK